MRFLIIEDNIAYRRYLSSVFLKNGADKIDFSNNLSEGVYQLDRVQYDLIFLDLDLPDSKGIETAQSVLLRSKEVPVIILTNLLIPDLIRRCVDFGVKGYLLKDASADQIISIKNLVAEGFFVVSKRAATSGSQIEDPGSEVLKSLTRQEFLVLKHLSDALTYAAIAKELGISLSTVQSHIKNIYRKLNCKNKIDATSFIRQSNK